MDTLNVIAGVYIVTKIDFPLLKFFVLPEIKNVRDIFYGFIRWIGKNKMFFCIKRSLGY